MENANQTQLKPIIWYTAWYFSGGGGKKISARFAILEKFPPPHRILIYAPVDFYGMFVIIWNLCLTLSYINAFWTWQLKSLWYRPLMTSVMKFMMTLTSSFGVYWWSLSLTCTENTDMHGWPPTLTYLWIHGRPLPKCTTFITDPNVPGWPPQVRISVVLMVPQVSPSC